MTEIIRKEDITMNTIEKAIQFAAKAHEGAVRKGTLFPYILHPVEAGAIAAQITGLPTSSCLIRRTSTGTGRPQKHG